MTKTIPVELMKDRYWMGTLHLFSNNYKLNSVFTKAYFNFEERTIQVQALKRKASPWSQSEKFMLNLALHLFNEQHKVNLGDMDYLDANNKMLAFEAIQKRYL